jgi:hypothetical protein
MPELERGGGVVAETEPRPCGLEQVFARERSIVLGGVIRHREHLLLGQRRPTALDVLCEEYGLDLFGRNSFALKFSERAQQAVRAFAGQKRTEAIESRVGV